MTRRYALIVLVLGILSVTSIRAYGDTGESSNLLGHTGYLTTPSAYISDGVWRPSYTFFSRSYPLNEETSEKFNSEIWAFSSSIGLFPFLEIYMSVYVLPQYNINHVIRNYGSGKWRTLGLKAKILDEKTVFPAVSIGVTDPDFKRGGASLSSPNLPSTYIVISKKLLSDKFSTSCGYGFDYFSGEVGRSRLQELFGGIRMALTQYNSIVCDYDGKRWSVGGEIDVRNVGITLSYTEGSFLATSIQYKLDLLKGIK